MRMGVGCMFRELCKLEVGGIYSILVHLMNGNVRLNK